jgi:hypothetical protein
VWLFVSFCLQWVFSWENEIELSRSKKLLASYAGKKSYTYVSHAGTSVGEQHATTTWIFRKRRCLAKFMCKRAKLA